MKTKIIFVKKSTTKESIILKKIGIFFKKKQLKK